MKFFNKQPINSKLEKALVFEKEGIYSRFNVGIRDEQAMSRKKMVPLVIKTEKN